MILNNLSQKDLIDNIGVKLLPRLQNLLPALSPDGMDETEIYKKTTLVRILMSFSPSQRLQDKQFMKTLLNAQSPKQLDAICTETGIGLNKNTFEQKVTALVGKGWSDPAYCEKFVKAAGLPASFIPKVAETRLVVEMCKKAARPFKRLKNYQVRVYERSIEELGINLSRFIMQMPTGSGKTRTSMEIITDFINKSDHNDIAVWIAHSEELIEQAIECFREVWEHLGERDVDLYRCYGNSASLPFEKSGTIFVFGGFQKLNSLLKKDPNAFKLIKKRVRLLIIDEAHKVLAPTYQDVTKALIGDRTKVIGLTATPGRSTDDLEQNAKLAEFFFNRIIGIDPPSNKTVFTYLRDKKILSTIIKDKLITNRDFTLTSDQIKYLEDNYDFPPMFLGRLSNDDIRNYEIVKKVMQETLDDRSILFFACSIEHSKFICAILTFFNINAVHLDGETPKGERTHIINEFKQKNIQVLCNYGVLATGFDAPKTDVVVISRPTASIVLYSQMIGRGLRGPVIGGTEHCKIIDVIDNIIGMPEESNIYDYFEQYWES